MSISREEFRERKNNLVDRIVYRCEDWTKEDGSIKVFFSLKPESNLPQEMVPETPILCVRPDSLDIYPFKRSSDGKYYDLKYPGIAQITLVELTSGPYEMPKDHSDVESLLERIPKFLENNPLNGLGFLSQDIFIANAISKIAKFITVIIGGGNSPPSYKDGIYFISENHLKQIAKSMRSITRHFQNKARTEKNLLAHNQLLTAVDKYNFPEKERKISSDTIFEMVKVGGARSKIPKSSHRGMVNLIVDNAQDIAKETPETLYKLAAKIESVSLQEMISKYKEKLAQSLNETKWQSFFEANTFILSMAFAVPTVFLKETPYVHGKRINGQGGKYSDFLMRSQGTGNVALIEIKSPETKILAPYRAEQQGPSTDLAGAITQVLGQRRKLTIGWTHLKHDDDGTLNDAEAISPQAVVLIGKLPQSRLDKEAFDAFRHVLKDVTVLTFDELLFRLEYLHKSLTDSSNFPDEDKDSIPF